MLPQVPDGEDDVSFLRHNAFLKKEFLKRNPNMVAVDQIMDTTFAMRRNDILVDPRSVSALLDCYPFLGVAKEASSWITQ